MSILHSECKNMESKKPTKTIEGMRMPYSINSNKPQNKVPNFLKNLADFMTEFWLDYIIRRKDLQIWLFFYETIS